MVASTSGYWALMCSPQVRHLARSRSQLTTGMLSYQAMEPPHPGHRERGRTTDSPLGHREMHTLRNDPSTAPKAANAGA